MANMIDRNPISGASVYGVEQYSYTVEGVAGKDYAAALTAASFKEAVAIEQALSAYSEVVRQRMRKIEELGDVMSYLNAAAARLTVKDKTSDDQANVENGAWVNATALKYGITLVFVQNTSNMTRRSIYNGQNAVQYAIDREDNDLKQDTVSLNSYVSKRDNSFSTASKLVKKALDAASSTIGNIG